MATIPYTVSNPLTRSGTTNQGALLVTWGPMANGDVGVPYSSPHMADKSVQVSGTFGAGGNLRIEGSNQQGFDSSGNALTPTYATLNDPQGTALNFTAAGIKAILENTNLVRPNVTAGDGTTSLTVSLCISTPARSA